MIRKSFGLSIFLYFCKTLCPSVIRKFFPLDKNYLLEEAQLALQDELLCQLVSRVKSCHEQMHNPLGLKDEFHNQLINVPPKNLNSLYLFYHNLSGVYRFKFGENQLAFLWDGRDHLEKYKSEWTETFQAWTNAFCKQPLFLQAVLDLTIFLPENQVTHLVENRMNHFIVKHLEVKIHKSRGIMAVQVA